MLEKSTLTFLAALKTNNNKPWFDANRKQYEAAKKNFETLTTQVIQAVSVFDSSIANLTAKQCTFRINRDVRFSKDKSPYKTNMAMHLSNGGKNIMRAGYYFHAEPGGAFLAGGVWMPAAPELKKIRQEIDYNFPEFKKIISAKKFVETYSELEQTDVLTRPPKGYEIDNPAIDFLKLKSFTCSTKISNEMLLEKDLVKSIAAHFKIMQPLIQFLNRALDSDEN